MRFVSFISKSAFAFVCWFCIGEVSGQTPEVDRLKNELAGHQKMDTLHVNILNELSYQFQWTDFYQSLNYADSALKRAEMLSYKKGMAIANYRLAHCYWALGDSELAIEKGLKAVDLVESESQGDIVAESYRVLAMCYRDQKEIEKARYYIKQAEILSLHNKNWDLLSRVYNLAGVIEYIVDDYDSALYLYNKALQVAKNHITSRFHFSQVLSNIGECYLYDNPDLGIDYFNRALVSAKETKNRSAEAGITADLGRAYLKKNRLTEANQYLETALALSRELGLKRVIRHVYAAMIDLKLKEGKTAEALHYTQKYDEINDSLLNIAKTRHIVELESRYESEKRNQLIKLLEQEKRIQTLWKNVLIVGTLLLLIAISIIYRLQSLRSRKTKELLQTQQQLNAKLKETDQLKSRFFANISHEFRTPLSLILAPIEKKLSKASEHSNEYKTLKLIQRNANRLLDLVNQLLDLSKLEAGKMQLTIKKDNLQTFIKVLSASFDSLAESKQINFDKVFSMRNPVCWFDSDKLEKIISNLLINAFKFTPAGGTVKLYLGEASHSNGLIIKISDTGKGISKEEHQHIFSPFYQSRHAIDDGNPGTGLGLSLVSELVKLYHGEVSLESEPNTGTTLTISLPSHKMEWASILEESTSESQQLLKPGVTTEDGDIIEVDSMIHETSESILIIEDNQDLRSFIASQFRDQFTVFTAGDGKSGFELAAKRLPDLIISDVMMPNMDGVELTEKLKTDGRTSHIPIVLLTAKADQESRIEGLSQGADDYLAKPFSTQELQIRVHNLIEQRKKLAAKFKSNLSHFVEEPRELTVNEKFMLRAKQIVDNNLSNYSFGVEKLAEEMNLSRTQLFRKFKAIIDLTPSAFINDIRLQRAAKMIRSKTDTLAQISYAVGFNEQSYFAKRFRKKFGMSPSEYADQL